MMWFYGDFFFPLFNNFFILIICFINSSYHRRKCKFLENNGRLVTDISILIKCSRLQIHWCFDILQICAQVLTFVIKNSPYQCIHMHIKIKLLISISFFYSDGVGRRFDQPKFSAYYQNNFDYINKFFLLSFFLSICFFFFNFKYYFLVYIFSWSTLLNK